MAEDLPAFGDMLDAFIRPPRVFEVGYRHESAEGEVLIVTSVEIWPWRTVVRGVTANRTTRWGTPFQSTSVDASEPPDNGEHTPEVNLVSPVQRARELGLGAHRVRAEAMMSWHLDDNAGTTYRATGWHGRGSMWSDFEIEFKPGAPSVASLLTITPTVGEPIPVRLGQPQSD